MAMRTPRRALLGSLLAMPALAQPGFPSRPLRIVVPGRPVARMT